MKGKFLALLIFTYSVIAAPTLRPGGVTILTWTKKYPDNAVLICGEKEFSYALLNNLYVSFVSEDYYSLNKEKICSMKWMEKEVQKVEEIGRLEIKKYEYHLEKLKVHPKRVYLSKKDQMRADREREEIKKIYSNFEKQPFFSLSFIQPLESHITSVFGIRRIMNGKETQHLGTDFRAAIGTTIIASNNAKVVFTGNLFYGGNMVILDHGLGIFSMYAHLSKILVKQGEMIKQGDKIGLSGMTGRVNGPHLHWGVYINGNLIDGVELVEESKKLFSTFNLTKGI